MLREEVVRGGVEPPAYRFQDSCGAPLRSKDGGVLWVSRRRGGRTIHHAG